MTTAKKEKWLGGYVRAGKLGGTYVIERWLNGVHWHVSTKCRTERAALKELEKFEADPKSYRRRRTEKTTGVVMTPVMLAKYLAHMEARQLDPPYVTSHEVYLGAIMVALEGRDLSHMTFVEVREAIEVTGDPKFPASLAARSRAMKAFGKWLRKVEGKLTRTNDPTIDLSIAHASPEKNRRRKAMSLEDVEATVRVMDPDVADVAIVLAATGLHIRELRRVHQGHGGLYEPVEWQRAKGIVLNLSVLHKRGTQHVVALGDQAAADAARRIMARPDFPTPGRITRHVINANLKTGLHFSMGWLRHSVATWLALQHVPLRDIATQLGHTSDRMAASTYVDMGLTAHVVPIPHLKLVKG